MTRRADSRNDTADAVEVGYIYIYDLRKKIILTVLTLCEFSLRHVHRYVTLANLGVGCEQRHAFFI
jgi:hypothetical protein